MHLGNGAITPECVALTVSAASAGLGLCAWSARREATNVSRLALAAGLGAFVFAAQAVNVPILFGVSAHLVGGVLLAWTLGPAVGAMTMVLVLALQAFLLGDGGTFALGANIVNMALLPAALIAFARRHRWIAGAGLPATPRELAAVSVLSALAIVAASVAVVIEVALFRSASELTGWTTFAWQMLIVHLPIAAGEAAATAALVASLGYGSRVNRRRALLRPALLASAGAVCLGLFAAAYSSDLPDGYQYAAQKSGLAEQIGE